MNSTKYLSII